MKMTRALTYIMVLLAVSAGLTTAGEIGDMKALSAEPADSAQEANQRIWLGIERGNACRVTINVVDDSSRIIRHLFDRLLTAGYYNLYWDKQDDSGRFVEAGQYRYLINDCGNTKGGILTAGYIPGEREIRLYNEEPGSPGLVSFDVDSDSMTVTIAVFRGTRLVDTPVVDSVMLRGHHDFVWNPAKKVRRGRYRIELKAGDFIHRAEYTRAR